MGIAAPSIQIHSDYETALTEFVVVPLADYFGITGEQFNEQYDAEIIFSNVADYTSINGVEGWILTNDDRDQLIGLAERNMVF